MAAYHLSNKRFDVNVNISKDNNELNPNIESFIWQKIPTAIKLKEAFSEVKFQIPQNESEKFQELFKELDANLQQLGIKSYGLSTTTFEEALFNSRKDQYNAIKHEPSSSQEIIEESKHDNIDEEKKELAEKINNGDTMSIANDLIIQKDKHDIQQYSIAENHETKLFFKHF